MKDMRLYTLDEISRPKQWKTIPQKVFTDYGHPVYGANGIIGYYPKFTHESPTIAIGCRGSCGQIHLTEPNSYINGNAMALDNLDVERVDIRYLYNMLKADGLKQTVTGTSQPQITQQSLKAFKFPLPPLEEQRRIAAILDAADAIRAKRRRSIKLLDDFLRATFLDMFGDPVSNPKGWAIKTVGDCIQENLIYSLQDGNHGEAHPKSAEFTKSGIPFIAASDISSGKINYDTCNYLTAERASALRIGFGKENDVLLSHKGSIGFSAIVGNEYDFLMLTPQVTYYRLNPNFLMPTYLKHYFMMPYFQTILKQFSKQSTRAYIGITRQKVLPIVIPDVKIQNVFTKIVKKQNSILKTYENNLNLINSLFASLSHRAFSGELSDSTAAQMIDDMQKAAVG